MSIFFIILACAALYRIRLVRNDDYISTNTTTSVKGFFISIVFLSHVRGYISLGDGILDLSYDFILNVLGQLMVAMFFFYSGYGCFESYRKKTDYEKHFFKRRIVKTWIHFVLALPIYIVINISLGISYPLKNYLLCWIGWESIGNSNWYVFSILALYYILLLGFLFTRKKDNMNTVLIVLAMTVVMMLLLYISDKGSWWYNTALCFPAGMMFSLYKDRIDHTVQSGKKYWIICLVSICVFIALYIQGSMVAYCLCAPVFCFIVVLITMKIRFGNAIMNWLGDHLFEIYILQRIPMIILEHLGVVNKYIFVTISFCFTVVASIGFKMLTNKIDSRLV